MEYSYQIGNEAEGGRCQGSNPTFFFFFKLKQFERSLCLGMCECVTYFLELNL